MWVQQPNHQASLSAQRPTPSVSLVRTDDSSGRSSTSCCQEGPPTPEVRTVPSSWTCG